MEQPTVSDAFAKGPKAAAVFLNIGGNVLPNSAIATSSDDALYAAIKGLLPHDATFGGVSAETHGTTTLAYADFHHNGSHVTGEGSDKDPFVAKAKAIVDAVNQSRRTGVGPTH